MLDSRVLTIGISRVKVNTTATGVRLVSGPLWNDSVVYNVCCFTLRSVQRSFMGIFFFCRGEPLFMGIE